MPCSPGVASTKLLITTLNCNPSAVSVKCAIPTTVPVMFCNSAMAIVGAMLGVIGAVSVMAPVSVSAAALVMASVVVSGLVACVAAAGVAVAVCCSKVAMAGVGAKRNAP